jgi:hypothetical protein
MAPRRRDDADQSAQECDGLEHQVGAAIWPGPLEPVRDPAVAGPGQPILGERRTGAVAAQALERVAIVVGDHDAGVQRESVAPGTQAFVAAYTLGGGR